MKERQLVTAAVDLLTSEGASAVTPAAVARRAGLARTSIYQYARSNHDLLGLAVEEVFVRVRAALETALEAAGNDPRDRLEAIIRTVLRGAVDGHSAAPAIDVAALAPEQQQRLHQLHDELVAPLTAAIEAVGAQDAPALTAISWGAINGVVPLVKHGMPLERAVRMASAYVLAGVGSQTPDQ